MGVLRAPGANGSPAFVLTKRSEAPVGRWSSDRPYPKSPTKPCWWICRPMRSAPSSNDRKCRLRSATASCSSGLSRRLCFLRPWRPLALATKSRSRRTNTYPLSRPCFRRRACAAAPAAGPAPSVGRSRRSRRPERRIGTTPWHRDGLPRPFTATATLEASRHCRVRSISGRSYMRRAMVSPERPQSNRLLIDTIYRAVRRMKVGDSEGGASATRGVS